MAKRKLYDTLNTAPRERKRKDEEEQRQPRTMPETRQPDTTDRASKSRSKRNQSYEQPKPEQQSEPTGQPQKQTTPSYTPKYMERRTGGEDRAERQAPTAPKTTAPKTTVDHLVDTVLNRSPDTGETPQPEKLPYRPGESESGFKPLSYSNFAGTADQIKQYTGNEKDESGDAGKKPVLTATKPASSPAEEKKPSAWEDFADDDEGDGGVEEETPDEGRKALETAAAEAQKKLADLDAQDKTWWGPMDWDTYQKAQTEAAQANKALEDYDKPELVNWEGRDELIKELEEIDTNSGMISTPEEAQAAEARRAEIIRELEAGDEAAGNGLQSYGDVDRGRQVVSGAAGQYAAGMTNAAGTALDFIGSLGDIAGRRGNAAEWAGLATDPMSAGAIGTGTEEEKQAWSDEMQKVQDFLQPVADIGHSVEDYADRLGGNAAKDLESAKAGLSGLGEAGVDIAANMIQMGFDASLGGLGAMFVRSAGSASQEARQAGAEIEDQVGYGLTKGGIEVATEKLFDGVAGIFGKGAADDIVEDVIGRLASTDTGRTVLRLFASAGGEGGEEVISDLLAPFAEQIYKDDALKDLFENGYNGGEMLYDFLIGAAIGGLGGGTSIATGQDAAKNAELRAEAAAPEVDALVQASTPQAPSVAPGMEVSAEADNGGGIVTPGGKVITPAAQEAQETAEAQEGIPVPPQAEEASTAPVNEFNTQEGANAAEARAEEQAPPAPKTAKEAAKALGEALGLAKVSSAVESGLQEIADYIKSNNNGAGIDEATLNQKAEALAEDIIGEIPGEETGDRATFEAVTNVLGKRGLQISDELRGDVADYNEWRKSLFGKLNLVKSGEAIDSIYSELSTLLPGLFPSDVTAQSDQINRIVDVLDGTKPKATTWADNASQEDYDAAVAEMTQQVLDAADGVSSEASAVGGENLASLEGEEPPVMLDGNPTTPTTVEAKGPTVERGFAENVRTTDSTDEKLAKSLGEDKVTYERLLNKDVLARAQELYDQGSDRAKSYLYDTIYNAKNGAKLPPEAVPLARMVANQMAEEGDVVGAERLIADVAAELTAAGQLGQVGKILRQGIKTPEGRLYGMQKTVESLNRAADGRYEVELPQELVEKYNEQTTDEGRNAVITEMQQAIADQIPATWMEKFTALRYTAMLGNFKTQARNVGGNIMSTVGRMAKDRVAAVMEGITYALSGGKTERTKSIWAGGRLYKEALGDFENVAEETMGEGKYSDNKKLEKDIEDKRTIFKFKPLELWRKGTNWAMDFGDRIFNAINYADALGGWLAAHNIKSISDASPEMLERARAYAIQQAQEATFRDSNDFSETISKLGRNNANTKTGKVLSAVGEGIMPFRKTPANILVRAEEYSPLGVINTFADAYKAVKGEGDVTASDVIDQAAKTLTGSGVMMLGYLLAKAGMARGKDDDKDQENFDKLRGAQDYSIIMPDGTSVTMDWVAPYSIPFFMGVQLEDAMADGGLTLGDAKSIIESFSDPMLEMSMLDGLNDALDVVSSYSDDNSALVLVGENALASLLSQASPTLMGQIESYFEDYRQSTYTDPNSALPTSIQRALSRVGAKIPGWDYQQQDYIDAWGRKQETKDGAAKVWETFFSPYYTSEDRSTPIDDELQRLYDAGNSKVFPSYASRNPGGDLGRLPPEEYETYATVKGQTSLALVQDFIESEQYKDLSDSERAEIIGNLYNLANNSAKTAVMRQREEGYSGVENNDYVTPLTDAGMSADEVASFLIGVSGDGTPTQADLKDYYKEHPDADLYIGALWDAAGYTKNGQPFTWKDYTSK